MRKRILSSIIYFFIVLTGKAQFCYPIQKDAEDFQKRALIVHLMEEDEKVLKDIKAKVGKNPTELAKRLETYSLQIQAQNELLKAAVSRYWKANKSVDFRTRAEMNTLFSDSKILHDYAVLEVGWKTDFHIKPGGTEPVQVFAFVAFVAEAPDRTMPNLRRSPTQKTDYIFKVAYPTDNLQLSDYIFAVHQFNFHLKSATVDGQTLERYRTMVYVPPFNKAGYETLKKKTLMLPPSLLDSHSVKEIDSVYVFHSVDIGIKLFEESVEQQFAKYAYITKVWSDRQSNFTYMVVGASEGIILVEMGAKTTSPKVPVHFYESNGTNYYKNEIGINLSTLSHLHHILNPKN